MREIPQPPGTLKELSMVRLHGVTSRTMREIRHPKELSMVRAGRRAQQIDPTRNGVLCGRSAPRLSEAARAVERAHVLEWCYLHQGYRARVRDELLNVLVRVVLREQARVDGA